MKQTRFLHFLMALCTMLYACGQEQKQQSAGNHLTDKLNDAVSKTSKSNPSGEGKQIVIRYQQQLPALLTKAMAAAVSGFPEAEAKEEYNTVLKDPVTHHIQYSWKNGRKGKIRGLSGEYPVNDVVKLSWFKSTSLEVFRKDYHTPTADELKKMDEVLTENTSNDPTGTAAKDMAKAFTKGLIFEEVRGVGEYAVWNNKYKELCVYVKGLQFILFIEISADESLNKEKVIVLAKKIINEKLGQ